MNTEIPFSLLYPSVHLLLRASKLAAPVSSTRKLLPRSIHPISIRSFSVLLFPAHRRNVVGVHKQTLQRKTRVLLARRGDQRRWLAARRWWLARLLSLVDLTETGGEQGRGNFVSIWFRCLKGTVNSEWCSGDRKWAEMLLLSTAPWPPLSCCVYSANKEINNGLFMEWSTNLIKPKTNYKVFVLQLDDQLSASFQRQCTCETVPLCHFALVVRCRTSHNSFSFIKDLEILRSL